MPADGSALHGGPLKCTLRYPKGIPSNNMHICSRCITPCGHSKCYNCNLGLLMVYQGPTALMISLIRQTEVLEVVSGQVGLLRHTLGQLNAILLVDQPRRNPSRLFCTSSRRFFAESFGISPRLGRHGRTGSLDTFRS